MLGTFILGIAAAMGAPYAEPRVKAFLGSILPDGPEMEPVELRTITFAACLLGAAIISMFVAAPHATILAFGAAIGAFAPKLKEIWKASKAPDYDS